MNLYFILYFLCFIAAAFAKVAFAKSNAAKKHPFDPSITYKFDDRRPIPDYIYED